MLNDPRRLGPDRIAELNDDLAPRRFLSESEADDGDDREQQRRQRKRSVIRERGAQARTVISPELRSGVLHKSEKGVGCHNISPQARTPNCNNRATNFNKTSDPPKLNGRVAMEVSE